jgi:uncharacterized membrane protein
MTRRKGAPDGAVDDGPQLISLDDKHRAHRLLKDAVTAGQLDEAEYRRRLGRVYASVTQRDLWKASGHRAGSPKRSDRADIMRAVRLQLAIVVFAVVMMMVILLGTILYQQGGTEGVHVWPWEWGRD